MWYQSPLIGPMGLGPPELQSVAAAQFLVQPGFGPTGMAVLHGGSPQSTGIYNGFSLYSHSYTPHFPTPQYYPPPPQPITQFPQFHTLMTTMVDFSHSMSQIHSQTPHTYNQSYTSPPLHHQFTSNSPKGFSQPSVQFVPTKTTITPPIHQFVPLSQHNPPLGCVKLEETLNSHTPSLTEMRLEPNFIIDRSPKEKLKSARVQGKFKVMSRIMKKREHRLGFSRQKQSQLSPILNSFLELSVHGDNSASGGSLHKSNPSDVDTTTINRGYGCLHQHPELHAYESSTYTTSINNAEKPLEDCDSLTGSLNLETSFLLPDQEIIDGLMEDEEVCFTTSLASTRIELDSKEPLNVKIEIVEPLWENASGKFKSAISNRSCKNLFLEIGCLHKDQFNKPSNEKSEFNVVHLFDKRLQLEGLYSYGRIKDAMFGWLLESVIVPVGDMNSMDFFFEVFLSLPYTYHNWRAILNWFLAAVIQCSVDHYMFIDNILLGDIGGRVSLHFGFKMERMIRNVENMLDVIWQRWKSQIITVIIEIFVKELNMEFFGNYMKLAWILLDIHHTSLFRNDLLLLTASAKDIHVLQEFKGFHFHWVLEVIQFALFLYLNLQELVSFYLLHQELIYSGYQHTGCQLEIPSNFTYGITVRYKRLLQFLSQYLRLLAPICGPYEETIEISFAEFSKTYEPRMVIHIGELLTTRRYQAIVSSQLGYSLTKGLLFLFIVIVGNVSHMSIQLGSKKLGNNIGWTYWQKQVDHHGRDVIGNSRDQINNANCGVNWVRVIHILNQPSSYSLEIIGFLITAFELSHWRYENITWFLLLNLCLWLLQFLQIIIHNETSFLVINCDSRFLVINCDSLLEQHHNYLKVTCDLEGLIDWKCWLGYQVVLGIGIAGFGLYNHTIYKQLPQYRSVKIIQRNFSLEALRVYTCNSGKVPTDNSHLVWPFNVVLKLPFEEKSLTIALQINGQLTKMKTKLSDVMGMAKPRNKRNGYNVSVGIVANLGFAVVVLWLMSVNTIWVANVAFVQIASLFIKDDNLLRRRELSNKGSQQIVESFLKKNIVEWVQWIGATT